MLRKVAEIVGFEFRMLRSGDYPWLSALYS